MPQERAQHDRKDQRTVSLARRKEQAAEYWRIFAIMCLHDLCSFSLSPMTRKRLRLPYCEIINVGRSFLSEVVTRRQTIAVLLFRLAGHEHGRQSDSC